MPDFFNQISTKFSQIFSFIHFTRSDRIPLCILSKCKKYVHMIYTLLTCTVNTCASIYHLLSLAMFDFNFKGFVDGNYLHMCEFHTDTSFLALIVLVVFFRTYCFAPLSSVVACSLGLCIVQSDRQKYEQSTCQFVYDNHNGKLVL